MYCCDHFEMYRNLKSLCSAPGTNIMLSIILQNQINKLIEKEISFLVTRGRGWGDGEFDESSQKL